MVKIIFIFLIWCCALGIFLYLDYRRKQEEKRWVEIKNKYDSIWKEYQESVVKVDQGIVVSLQQNNFEEADMLCKNRIEKLGSANEKLFKLFEELRKI